jgi:hypothetical protein
VLLALLVLSQRLLELVGFLLEGALQAVVFGGEGLELVGGDGEGVLEGGEFGEGL